MCLIYSFISNVFPIYSPSPRAYCIQVPILFHLLSGTFAHPHCTCPNNLNLVSHTFISTSSFHNIHLMNMRVFNWPSLYPIQQTFIYLYSIKLSCSKDSGGKPPLHPCRINTMCDIIINFHINITMTII